MEHDAKQLIDLLASRFIQRRDVKAIQKGGAYMPVTATGRPDSERMPWTRADLEDHVAGRKSFGHYLIGQDGDCKLFAFDIDLTKWNGKSERSQPTWLPIDENGMTVNVEPKPLQPREAWLHPKAPPELRRFLVAQMRGVAELLATATVDVLGIPVAVSYSGNKGIHVYGFTGAAPAHDVRGAAMEVMDYTNEFVPMRGKNFFRPKNDDVRTGFACCEVEVFPKQNKIEEDGFGNLMRMPLGIHAKSGQRAYFLTLNSNIDELVEADPVASLESGIPWQ